MSDGLTTRLGIEFPVSTGLQLRRVDHDNFPSPYNNHLQSRLPDNHQLENDDGGEGIDRARAMQNTRGRSLTRKSFHTHIEYCFLITGANHLPPPSRAPLTKARPPPPLTIIRVAKMSSSSSFKPTDNWRKDGGWGGGDGGVCFTSNSLVRDLTRSLTPNDHDTRATR